MTSFLTLRPAIKALAAWAVNIHQVHKKLSLSLHPRSSNFRPFVSLIVQRGAILRVPKKKKKKIHFILKSFQYLVSFAKSNNHNPEFYF